MKKECELKKKIGAALMVLTVVAAGLGAFAPAAPAQGEDAGYEGGLPPELQEYEGRIREALAALRGPLERVRTLAGELRDSKGAVRNALSEKGESAAEAFAEELRAYRQHARDVLNHLRKARAAARGPRVLRRQVARALREGDTGKAVEIIETALAGMEKAKSGLEHLLSDMEALMAEQAGLVEAISSSTK